MNILFFIKPKNEVVYLYDDFTVRQAMEKMEFHKFSATPIINREGEYVGTVTEGDFLWFMKDCADFDIKKAEDTYLKDMKRKFSNQPVNVNSSMDDLLIKAISQNFVPVVDDHKKFIGIITRQEIIKYYYNQYKKFEQDAGTV